MTTMVVKTLLFLTIFPLLTYGVPVESCAKTCTNSNKFRYQPGKAYEFDYAMKTSTSVKGASEEWSSLELTAKVNIKAVSKCDFILNVENVQLFETDSFGNKLLSSESSRFSLGMEHHGLRFSFQDGVVEELCTPEGEPKWVLNIKRGILSVFQNSMDEFRQNKRLQEIDVTGQCDTEYSTLNTDHSSHSIQKTKNLLKCTERYGYHTSFQGVPYSSSSDFKSLPLLKSEHQCRQEITSDGLLTVASCVETHLFRPFSRDGHGAVTENTQILSFVQESFADTSPIVGVDTNRHRLTYEHQFGTSEIQTASILENVLMDICRNTRLDIRPDSSALFAELVIIMRALNVETLRKTYKKLTTGELCNDNYRIRKFFLDALPVTGTAASLRILTEVLQNKEVTGVETGILLTTLAMNQHPTKIMIKEIGPLISLTNEKAMLSVSSLISTYCRHASCERDIDVINILSTIEGKLEPRCRVDDSNLHTTIFSLRAIGNIGRALRSVQIINNCFTRRENPTEVRLAAIDALRRFSCNVNHTDLTETFRNKQEDSEVRIATYLAVMKCADAHVFDIIERVLDTEEDKQVASFVWCHIANLKETSDRHKENIRTFFQNINLPKDFELNKEKSSCYYEKSFFFEKFNVGASASGSLLWSHSSMLPISLMANLTVDLFGHSVNLIDVGGRVEGLDYLMQSYFGNNEKFSDNSFKKDHIFSKYLNLPKFVDFGNKLRSKRDGLRGSFYARIFGTEIAFTRFDGKNTFLGAECNILDLLIALSEEKDYILTQNVMFLDSSMTTPTSTGLPLTLKVNGTATVGIKTSGRIDLRKSSIIPRSVAINGAIQPSATLEVSSSMIIDAFVTKSGIKMDSTLHTSTAIQGKVELAHGRVIEAELDMSRDKIEIINFKTSFFMLKNNVYREQNMLTENRPVYSICSGENMAAATGLQLCSKFQHPDTSSVTKAPYFPLTGPLRMSLDLLKTDIPIGYKFAGKLVKNRGQILAIMDLDTPGSMVDRHLRVDFSTNFVDPSINLNIVSPWKKVVFTGVYSNTRLLRQLLGSVLIDDSREYFVNADLQQNRDGIFHVFTQKFELRIPHQDSIVLSSSVKYQPFKSVQVDIEALGLFRNTITATFTLQKRSMIQSILGKISFERGKIYTFATGLHTIASKRAAKYRPYLSLRTPTKHLLVFDGSAELKSGKSVTVGVNLRNIFKKDIKVFCTFNQMVHRRIRRYETKMNIRTHFLSTKVQSNIIQKGLKVLLSRSHIYYVIPGVIKDKVTINGKINIAIPRSFKGIQGTINVHFKHLRQYNTDIDIDVAHNPRTTKTDLTVKYGADKSDINKHIQLSITATHRMSQIQPSLGLRVTYIHLAQRMNVGLKTFYTHDGKSLESLVSVISGDHEAFILTIRFKNESMQKRNLSGFLLLSYNGRTVKLGNDLSEENEGVFSNKITAELEPHKRSTFVTTFRMPSKREVFCSVDINLVEMSQIRFNGHYLVDFSNTSLFTEIRHGRAKYSLWNSFRWVDSEVFLASEFKHPSRQIAFESSVKARTPVYTIRTEAMLKARKDGTRRIQVDGQATVVDLNNIRISMRKKSPFGTYSAYFSHNGGDKYHSHANFELGKSRRITLDTIYSDIRIDGNRNITGKLQFTSPFRGYRAATVESYYHTNHDQYTVNGEINWKPINKITALVNFRKPISLFHIVGNISVKSSFQELQSSSLHISHILEHKLMSSMTKLSWNRCAIQIIMECFNRGGINVRDFGGRMILNSTLKGYNTMHISGKHIDDGNQFLNSLQILKNGKGINYKADITHERYGWNMQNSGEVSCSFLSHSFQSSWNHSHSPSDINTKISSKFNKRHLNFNLSISQTFTSNTGDIALMMVMTGNIVPTAGLSVTHIHNSGALSNSVIIQLKRKLILSVGNKVQYGTGRMESSHRIQVKQKTYSSRSVFQCYDFPLTGLFEFKWPNQERIHLSGLLNKIGTFLNGNIDILVPKYKAITLSFRRENRFEELVCTASVYRASKEIVTVENRYRWDDIKLIHIQASNTFKLLRNIKFHTTFSGNMKSFHSESHLSLEYSSSRKIEIDVMLENIRNIEGTVLIRLPKRDEIRFLYLQTEIPLHIHIELQYHRKKSLEGDISFVIGDITELRTSLKTPFMKDITAIVRQEKFPYSLFCHCEIKYGFTKVVQTNIGFGWSRNISGNFALKSVYFKKIEAAFYHKGSLKKFATHLEFQFIPKTKYEIDVAFGREKHFQTQGLLSINIPGFNKLKAVFSHHGDLRELTTNAYLKCGYRKIETTVVFKTDPVFDTSVNITSPFNGYKTMYGLIKHEGSRRAFDTKVAFGIGKTEILSTVRFLLNPVFVEVNIHTPFTGYKQLRALFTHSGSFSQFQCQTEILYRKNKSLTGEVKFKAKPISGMVSFVSPFTKFETLALKFSLKQKQGKHLTFLDIILPRERRISVSTNVHYSVPSSVSASINILTPFQKYDEINAGLDVSGSFPDFECRSFVEIGKKQMVCLVQLKADESVVGEISLITPFVGYRKLGVGFHYVGESINFLFHTYIMFRDNYYEVDMTYSALVDYELSFVFRSPANEDIRFSTLFSQAKKRMSIQTGLVYGSREIATFEFQCRKLPKLKGSAIFKSVWSKPVKLIISHEGKLLNFQTVLKVEHESSYFAMDTMLKIKKRVHGFFKLKNTFLPLIEINAIAFHSPKPLNFQYNFSVTAVDKSLPNISVSINRESKNNLLMELETSYSEVYHAKFAVNQARNRDNNIHHLELELNEQKMEVESVLELSEDLSGRFILKTPWYEDIIGKFTHSRKQSAMYSHAQLNYAGILQYQVEVILTISPDKTLSVRLLTPLEYFRNMGCTVHTQGTLRQFSSSFELTFINQTMTSEFEFNSINGMEIRGAVYTPYTNRLIVFIDQKGNLMDMQCRIGISYGDLQQIELDTYWNFISSIDGTLSLTTPIEGFENILLKVNHVEGDLTLRSSIEVVYYKNHSITLHTILQDTLCKGSISFTSPIFPPMRASFSSTNGKLSGIVLYNESEQMSVNISYTEFPEKEVIFLFKSIPYGSGNVIGEFRNDLSAVNASMNFHVSLNGHLTITDVSFINKTKANLFLSTMEPLHLLRDSNISVSHTHLDFAIQTGVWIDKAGQQFLGELTVDLGSMINNSLRVKPSSLKMKDLIFKMNHSCSSHHCINHMHFEVSPTGKIVSNIDFTSIRNLEYYLLVETPLGYEQIRAEHAHSISTENISSRTELLHHPDKIFETTIDCTTTSAEITIKSPFSNFVKAFANFSSSFASNGTVSTHIGVMHQGKSYEFDISVSPYHRKFILKTPFEDHGFIAVFKNNLVIGRLMTHVNVTYQGKSVVVDTFLTSSNGSVTISTPYEYNNLTSFAYAIKMRNETFYSLAELHYGSRKVGYVVNLYRDSSHHFGGKLTLRTPFLRQTDCHVSFDTHDLSAGIIAEVESTMNNGRSFNNIRIFLNKSTATVEISVQSNFNNNFVLDFDIQVKMTNGSMASITMKQPHSIVFYINVHSFDSVTVGEREITKNDSDILRNETKFMEALSRTQLYQTCIYGLSSNLSVNNYTIYNFYFDKINVVSYNNRTYTNTVIFESNAAKLQTMAVYRSDAGWASIFMELKKDERMLIHSASTLVFREGLTKANVTLNVPGISKEVTAFSETIVHNGSTIYDVRLGVTFPRGSNKSFILYSRADNLSNATAKNYNFMIGVKHPETMLDLHLISHVDHTNSKYSAGIDFVYLTSNNTSKRCEVYAELDIMRKEITLQLSSPVKSLTISGQANTSTPSMMSVSGLIDGIPVSVGYIIDPLKQNIHVYSNYDSAYPEHVIVFEVHFVNDSAFEAVIYRQNSSQRLFTDGLLTVILCSPNNIQTRLHWRPQIIDDIKSYAESSLNHHRSELLELYNVIGDAVNREFHAKYEQLKQFFLLEIIPIVHFASENVGGLKQGLDVLIEETNDHLLRNNVHLNTLISTVYNCFDELKIDSLSRWMESTAAVYSRKDTMNAYLHSGQKIILVKAQKFNQMVTEMIDSIDVREVSQTLIQYTDKYNRYTQDYRRFLKYWSFTREDAIIQSFPGMCEGTVKDTNRTKQGQEFRDTSFHLTTCDTRMNIHLPVPVTSLKSFLDISVTKHMHTIKSRLQNWNDFVYNMTSWPLTFEATAYISGNNFTTFDGTFYQLSAQGRCSYILANDFIDDMFSVVLNIMSNGKRKLVISSSGHVLQIFPEEIVRIDGVIVDLPKAIGDLTVTRKDNNIIIKGRGFNVCFNSSEDIYQVTLSGLYIGKTGGLLGTYDNVRHNDMMMSTGKITSDINVFAGTWRVRGRCR